MSAPHEPAEVVQSRLGALASVAAAVSGAHELDEVLEIAADQILTALEVSSVSISRWHLEEGVLQTLINVGELGPGEERLPAYETYEIAMFPLAHAVLRRGEPHVTSLDDDNADEAERELLKELGKVACAAVPIVYEGETWGEIYITNGAGAPALLPSDLAFLQEICAQLAQAIGRAERFSELLDAAYRDALTGIANRRAFDEHLAGSLDPNSGAGVTLLLGDVDGLKAINDASGHAVGDATLRLVGTVLTRVCGPQARPARVGGDEFAVILDSGSVEAADALVAEIARALAAAGAPVGLSWGSAHSDPPHRGAAELTRA
ncbi:MAG: diguanylate cyclase protein, partial [Conexibacter sp.]|nr:diguanylate cyclase protein [Conexibacter sp.]